MLIILEFIFQLQTFKEFGKVFSGTQQAKIEISKGVVFPLPPSYLHWFQWILAL